MTHTAIDSDAPPPRSTRGPARRRLFGFVNRKERWSLSWKGWLLFGFLFVGLGILLVRNIHPFLAVTHRSDADTLVVEGWVSQYTIRAAVSEFKQGHYQRVFTTGGPFAGSGGYTNDYNTTAHQGCVRLQSAGLSADVIQMIPSRVPDRDRTYSDAVALRNWLRQHHVPVHNINVITEAAHARRSRLLFQRALGPDIKVGIVSVPSPDYDSKHWWHYSDGVKEIISEGAAYLYARLLFHPSHS
jgi:uncharacterized SAM-binding protein YcdF (DUF218 family)